MFEKKKAYVVLDVHKETTAVAWPDWEEPELRGILPNYRKSLKTTFRGGWERR